MQVYTDVAYADHCFYISDDALRDQASTLTHASGMLHPGEGIVQIQTNIDYGLLKVVVETHPQEPLQLDRARWDCYEEVQYATRLGLQRVRNTDFDECQGELADPITPPGPALVHLRAAWVNAPQPPSDLGVPIVALYLLQLWYEPIS